MIREWMWILMGWMFRVVIVESNRVDVDFKGLVVDDQGVDVDVNGVDVNA